MCPLEEVNAPAQNAQSILLILPLISHFPQVPPFSHFIPNFFISTEILLHSHKHSILTEEKKNLSQHPTLTKIAISLQYISKKFIKRRV